VQISSSCTSLPSGLRGHNSVATLAGFRSIFLQHFDIGGTNTHRKNHTVLTASYVPLHFVKSSSQSARSGPSPTCHLHARAEIQFDSIQRAPGCHTARIPHFGLWLSQTSPNSPSRIVVAAMGQVSPAQREEQMKPRTADWVLEGACQRVFPWPIRS
jgi:hypothetical protein